MKKILIVEDEPVLQKAFGDLLSGEGHRISSALDGENGLKMVKAEKPDLVLLDLILPKMHGLEVLRQLKESPETKDVPVIILTNLEGTDDVEKALELGATTYLIKASYTLKEVLSKIKQVLGE